MRSAIIVHGKPSQKEYYDPKLPSASNYHWIPWLQKQLIVNDIHAQTPEIPFCYEPKYNLWKKEFERFDLNSDTILVGHSCGGGFLVRWLSENMVKVGKVILVAPWLDPDREKTSEFFEFTIDQNLASRTQSLVIFNSDNDMDSIQKSVDIIKNQINSIGYREFHNMGHFTHLDMNTAEFPELLQEIIS